MPKKNNNVFGNVINSVLKNLVSDFYWKLSHYGLLLKDHSFREEKEWRLIYSSSEFLFLRNDDEDWHDEDDLKINFRSNSNTIIPYLDFDIREVGMNAPKLDDLNFFTHKGNKIDENSVGLIIGPSSNVNEAELAARFILSKHFQRQTWIKKSTIPFRKI